MPLAAPPPDRERSAIRPGRRRRGSTTAPLTPAAVAGMALLLALATLREPVAVASTEAAWSDSVHVLPTAGHFGGQELTAAVDLQDDGAVERVALQPAAISDDPTFNSVADDGSVILDEARAGAIALQLASRLGWQVTGSFTFAPFVGVWAGPWPSVPAMDSGIVVGQ